jgi:hypothetical protein
MWNGVNIHEGPPPVGVAYFKPEFVAPAAPENQFIGKLGQRTVISLLTASSFSTARFGSLILASSAGKPLARADRHATL